MSTDPHQPGSPPPVGYTIGAPGSVARLPVPGNAELLVYLLVEIVIAIIWAASDRVEAEDFVAWTAIVTVGYLLSRGIAKASRVLEH